MIMQGKWMLRERFKTEGGREYLTFMDMDNGGDIKVQDDNGAFPASAKPMLPYEVTAEVRGRLWGQNCSYGLEKITLKEVKAG